MIEISNMPLGANGTGGYDGTPNSGLMPFPITDAREGTIYESRFNGISRIAEAKSVLYSNVPHLKALTAGVGSSGTGTAGVGIIPVYVDSVITDIARKFTPATLLTPRVANQGITADYVRLTTKGAGVTRAEDAALAEVSDVYARGSQSIKYLYSVGRVTGPAQAAIPGYSLPGFVSQGAGDAGTTFQNANAGSAMQLEIQLRTQTMMELQENLFFNGNAGTDATQFNGIVALQSTTNSLDLVGVTGITMDNIDTIMDYAYDNSGLPAIAYCSKTIFTKLRQLMLNVLGMRPADIEVGDQLFFGIPSKIIVHTGSGPITLIKSQYLDDTAGSRSMYVVDYSMRNIEFRVLQDITYEELAKTNDSQKFFLKIYETLICRAPERNACIINAT